MVIIYEAPSAMNSKGITFTNGQYTVSDTVGEYLLKTFPQKFRDVTPKPIKPAKATSKRAAKKPSNENE